MPGLTGVAGAALAQAAAVCFDSQGHSSGVDLVIERGMPGTHKVFWDPVTDEMRRTWRDPTECTEYGAAGVAVLLADKLLNMVVWSRSYVGTGFDYWIGMRKMFWVETFEGLTRLEVSGIRRETARRRVAARVKRKVAQINRFRDDSPWVVIVVEFGKPQAAIDFVKS